jgi:integrase
MSILRQKKSIEIPENAIVKGNVITWVDKKNRKQSGKLTKTGRVLVNSEFWQIRYRDENGKERREPSGVKNREAAIAILLQREKEVERIKMNIATREEITVAKKSKEGIEKQLELFRTVMVAAGDSIKHIDATINEIKVLQEYCNADSIHKITREKITAWIAGELETKIKSPRTINAYVTAVKSFFEWAVESERLLKNPLKAIKKLNEDTDRRKKRRSLTEEELRRLIRVTRNSERKTKIPNLERELIYRLLVGTGIRSNELSCAKLSQFDFVQKRFTIDPAITKNRRIGYLPIRPDLLERLKNWCNENRLEPKETIFGYNTDCLLKGFYKDLKEAGIERVAADGRCLDVHSLRRTFGTMLARAGVPLTTTQRLMRHSSPELTAKLYIDVEPIDMSNAVERLPAID